MEISRWTVGAVLLLAIYVYRRFKIPSVSMQFRLWSGGFYNWERMRVCDPQRVLRPGTIEEVQAAVEEAVKTNGKLKVVGAGHSWNDMAGTTGSLVSLDAMSKILSRRGNHVTVQSGIRMGHLQAQLARQGLAFPVLPSVNEQSVGGVISTATHGNGLRFGNLSTYVRELKIVDGRGHLLTCSDTLNAEIWGAVRMGLGALGIIVEVTFELEPLFNVELHALPIKTSTLAERAREFAMGNDYFKFWIIPHSNVVQTFTYNRTESVPRNNGLVRKFFEDVVAQELLQLFVLPCSWFPILTRPVFKLLGKYGFHELRRVDRSDLLFNIPVRLIHHEIELALRIEDAADFIRDIPTIIATAPEAMNFIVEGRCVAGDDIWLSNNYERDSMVFTFGLYNRPHHAFFTHVEKCAAKYNARPHWAKTFSSSPEQLAAVYPRWPEWNAVRQRMDPSGVFNNPYLTRYFGAYPHN